MPTTSDAFAAAEIEQGPKVPEPRKTSLLGLSDALMLAFADQLRSSFEGMLQSSFIWRRVLSGPAPDRLLAQPRSFFPKSLVEGDLIVAGRFRLPGGEADASDGSPFFTPAPSVQWLENLHGFGWLRHLEAVGGEQVQDHARQLIAHWIRSYGQNWSDVAWRPHVIARRLMTWASFGRFVLSNADILFRSRVLWTMARQARHLAATVNRAPPGLPRLTAIMGLVHSGVTLPDAEQRLAKGLHLLSEELTAQILPDGGHISRNPEAVLVIMSDLLSIMDAMRLRNMAVPATVRRAIDRMTPMVRFMTLGDGKLANFNGGSEGPDGWSASLLMHEEAAHRVLTHAPHTAYDGLSVGPTIVIVDVGCAPPPEVSTEAHAGTLAFEMSVGRERLIVNCGAPLTKGADWRQATRATAAHSTLTIADTSSAPMVAQDFALSLLGPRLTAGPTHSESKREESADGHWLHMNHDGYVKPFGLLHERDLFLSNDGSKLIGTDRIGARGQRADAQPVPLALRFHLHPAVRPTLDAEKKTAMLALASGASWRFETSGDLNLAESIYCEGGDTIRKSSQLVVTAAAHSEPVELTWSLARVRDAVPTAVPSPETN
jgi:uncharacterized heparinase superfamily protein